MELGVTREGDVTVVQLPGDSLDASNAATFKAEIGPVMQGFSKVVFDLERIQFMDSSGLGAVLSCLKQLKASGGDLRLCAIRKPVMSLFELVRMNRVFGIYASRSEAVGSYR